MLNARTWMDALLAFFPGLQVKNQKKPPQNLCFLNINVEQLSAYVVSTIELPKWSHVLKFINVYFSVYMMTLDKINSYFY